MKKVFIFVLVPVVLLFGAYIGWANWQMNNFKNNFFKFDEFKNAKVEYENLKYSVFSFPLKISADSVTVTIDDTIQFSYILEKPQAKLYPFSSTVKSNIPTAQIIVSNDEYKWITKNVVANFKYKDKKFKPELLEMDDTSLQLLKKDIFSIEKTTSTIYNAQKYDVTFQNFKIYPPTNSDINKETNATQQTPSILSLNNIDKVYVSFELSPTLSLLEEFTKTLSKQNIPNQNFEGLKTLYTKLKQNKSVYKNDIILESEKFNFLAKTNISFANELPNGSINIEFITHDLDDNEYDQMKSLIETLPAIFTISETQKGTWEISFKIDEGNIKQNDQILLNLEPFLPTEQTM